MTEHIPKSDETLALKSIVLTHHAAIETNYAESCASTLSFTSTVRSNRHVWVDTDLPGQIVVNLEDWDDDSTWDNTVLSVTAKEIETAAALIVAWLSGETLESCKSKSG